jgi:hypothetical protein
MLTGPTDLTTEKQSLESIESNDAAEEGAIVFFYTRVGCLCQSEMLKRQSGEKDAPPAARVGSMSFAMTMSLWHMPGGWLLSESTEVSKRSGCYRLGVGVAVSLVSL